jgi:CRP-like cAMP-binding protein
MNFSEHNKRVSPFAASRIQDLDRYLERGQRVTLRKGEVLTQENEPRKGLFYLEEGVLKLARSILGMKPSTLLYVQDGELLGLDAMIHQRSHPYWIIATKDARMIHYPEADIRALMDKDPDFQLRLIRDLCKRLKLIEERMEDLVMKNTAQRLAEHILYLQQLDEEEGEEGFEFHMEEAADHIGSTPDYLHKVIIQMSKRGTLILRKKKLKVLDAEGLRQIATGE